MKRRIVAGVAVLVSQLTFAEGKTSKSEEEVLLVKRVGYLSTQSPRNKKAECLVRRNHPALKALLATWDETMHRTGKESLQTAYHFVAQVPSLEIYAQVKKKGKDEKLLLVEDHSTLKTRQGPDAEKLIQLVHKLCPTP